MVFFPNEQLELYQYTETLEVNSYMDPKHEYRYKETVPCDFQNMTPSDDLKEFGEIQEDTYKIYLDSKIEVDHKMVLKLENKPDTYEITGIQQINNHLPIVNHTKLIIQRHRKPVPVIKPPEEPIPVPIDGDNP